MATPSLFPAVKRDEPAHERRSMAVRRKLDALKQNRYHSAFDSRGMGLSFARISTADRTHARTGHDTQPHAKQQPTNRPQTNLTIHTHTPPDRRTMPINRRHRPASQPHLSFARALPYSNALTGPRRNGLATGFGSERQLVGAPLVSELEGKVKRSNDNVSARGARRAAINQS